MATLTPILCAPCGYEKHNKIAKKLCTVCKEGLCGKCENMHLTSKMSEEHMLIANLSGLFKTLFFRTWAMYVLWTFCAYYLVMWVQYYSYFLWCSSQIWFIFTCFWSSSFAINMCSSDIFDVKCIFSHFPHSPSFPETIIRIWCNPET
jgi:hypothetical protein